ncbi:hypothetical protein AgCh_034056 [Apium graveolens]
MRNQSSIDQGQKVYIQRRQTRIEANNKLKEPPPRNPLETLAQDKVKRRLDRLRDLSNEDKYEDIYHQQSAQTSETEIRTSQRKIAQSKSTQEGEGRQRKKPKKSRNKKI